MIIKHVVLEVTGVTTTKIIYPVARNLQLSEPVFHLMYVA